MASDFGGGAAECYGLGVAFRVYSLRFKAKEHPKSQTAKLLRIVCPSNEVGSKVFPGLEKAARAGVKAGCGLAMA